MPWVPFYLPPTSHTSSVPRSLREFFCILFWITVILATLSVFHLLLYRFVRKRARLPDLVVFPGLELLAVTAALIAIVTACTTVIARESVGPSSTS